MIKISWEDMKKQESNYLYLAVFKGRNGGAPDLFMKSFLNDDVVFFGLGTVLSHPGCVTNTLSDWHDGTVDVYIIGKVEDIFGKTVSELHDYLKN